MVTVRVYENNSFTTRDINDVVKYAPQAIPPESVVWIDMSEPTDDEESLLLHQWLQVHQLVLDDMHRARESGGTIDPHHPAVEEYESYLFVMVHAIILPTARADATTGEYLRQIRVGQLNVILTERAIVTHHPVRVEIIASIQRFLQSNPLLCKRGPDFLLSMILDALTRNVGTVLDKIDVRMEELEDRMFKSESIIVSSRLMELRRMLNSVRRSLTHQDEVVYELGRGDYNLVDENETIYYREVHDHYIMALEHVDSLRDSITGLMEVYFALISSRLNQVMRVLTVISTIFLPITFITSLYGMNFRFMPELSWPIGYPLVLVAILIVSGTMLLFFKRRGWLG